jgi:glycosyltransferase involved in cell wall biosynthesis
MQMVPYLAGRARPPLFIDVMDDAVLEHLRDLRHSRSPRALLRHLLQLIVSFRFERTYYRGAAALCLVSERDAAFISRLVPGARTVVIHNGVDAEEFRPLGSPRHHPSVIFEGTMSFPPNVDAVQYFHAEIFPLVKRGVPGTVFYIVGRDPSPEVRALAGPDTIVTGSVEDVRPYYDRASVFACTMRRGAGIKNKILQAWAMCTPVVATSVATGGLCVVPGVNIEVADRPPDIAAAIVRLLGDAEARRRLGQGGRDTVLAHYSWDEKCRELERAFEECLQGPLAARDLADAAAGRAPGGSTVGPGGGT